MARAFNPSRPRSGRLVRLGVIVDAAGPLKEQQAVITDASGVEVLWLADRLGPLPTWDGGWDELHRLASLVRRSRVGVALASARIDEAGFGRLAATLGEQLDVTLTGLPEGVERLRRVAPLCRVGLCDEDAESRDADDVVLPAGPAPVDRASETSARLGQSGRRDDTGLALVLPVAIGRTMAEAKARLARSTVFDSVGSPMEAGLYGRLEAAQERVIELAHAGVTDLRCVIPDGLDSHDMVAQLTAVATGTTAVLRPGTPRSPDPPPPEGWGGPKR